LEGASMTNHIFEGFMKRGEHQDVLQPDVLDKLRKKFGQDADCSKKQWADLGTTRPADFPTIGDEVTSRIVRKQFPQVQLYVADEASARFYLSFRGPQPILEACVVVESILQFVSMKREGLSIHLFQPLIVPPSEPDVSAPEVSFACLTPPLVSPHQMSRRYWEGVKDMIGRTFDPLSRLRMKDIMVDMLRNPDLRGGFSDYDDIRAEFAWEGVSDVLTQLEELNV
ncbi:hypothetical protein KFL_003790010, partial [Klebsormidium nitens]